MKSSTNRFWIFGLVLLIGFSFTILSGCGSMPMKGAGATDASDSADEEAGDEDEEEDAGKEEEDDGGGSMGGGPGGDGF